MEDRETRGKVIEDTKVPVSELTVEYLVNKGMDIKTAQAVIRYANLFTGSNRRVDDEFLEIFREQGESLGKQGISVQHQIVEKDPNTEVPLRIFYAADWQRPVAPPPRGQRGAFPRNLQNQPILEKKFIISHNKIK